MCALLSVGVVVEKGPPARSPRGVTRIQTEKLRSAESYVPADGTCGAPSLFCGLLRRPLPLTGTSAPPVIGSSARCYNSEVTIKSPHEQSPLIPYRLRSLRRDV